MKVLYILILVINVQSIQAQTVEEWTAQRKTQIKYLLQQIAALKVYTDHVQKGCAIAKKGLTAIDQIRKGDFNLHQEFFHSLKTVNPAVKRYTKVADMVSLYMKIVKQYKQLWENAKKSNQFNKEELSYIDAVLANVVDGCKNTMDELINVITDGKMELKDGERLQRIDGLYIQVQDRYAFMGSFAKDVQILCMNRLRERASSNNSKVLHGLK